MRSSFFVSVILSCVLGVSLRAAETVRPNIVFIMSDDHAWQAVSAYGDERKLIQTPNIDRIAREGMRFDRCLVTNAICGPSRATILTGKYNHLNGFPNNSNSMFDGSQTTFPKLLQAAGYQTAMIGKWHLGSDPTGFDFWQILNGQGLYYNPRMKRNGEWVSTEGYVTDITTDVAIDWLKQRDTKRPFLLMCHQKAPHREWEPSLEDLGYEKDRTYPEPASLFDDFSGRGEAERTQDMMIARTLNRKDLKLNAPSSLTPDQRKIWDSFYDPIRVAFETAPPTGRDLVRWKYQRYLHDYLACVHRVDENVGRLLDYLEREGLAENTLIVYTSDQGFFLGEHGWFDKRWIFEESLRTPLVMRWPAVIKAGSANRAIVSNVDFAETFLTAAQLPVPAEMQGRSLLPLMEGHTPKDWRTSFYYRYYEFPTPHHVQPHEGVVTERYKLVHFDRKPMDAWELFDLDKDPQEMKSVYGDVSYAEIQSELSEELKRLRKELKVPEETPEWFFGGPAPGKK